MNQATNNCLNQNISHPTYGDGRTNQVIVECLGKKILVFLPTGATNEPSHQRVPW